MYRRRLFSEHISTRQNAHCRNNNCCDCRFNLLCTSTVALVSQWAPFNFTSGDKLGVSVMTEPRAMASTSLKTIQIELCK